MTQMFDTVAIGECMIEFSREPDGRFMLGYGGDTFNTAAYLARAGVRVGYATRIGDDPYSAGIRELARANGIGCELIETAPGRNAGLYVIDVAPGGERQFHYWRDRSPARDLFDASTENLRSALAASRLVCLSAITLSLYDDAGLQKCHDALVQAKARGARIVIDGNYRPRGWGGDAARAREVVGLFWRLADVGLPTFDDEQALWGDAAPAATIARLQAAGVGEIVVKCGAGGAWIAGSDGGTSPRHVPCPHVVTPVDTTAAGDSFNAGYLARRLAGEPQAAAVLAGHRLAAIVIAHRGALAPDAATRGELNPVA